MGGFRGGKGHHCVWNAETHVVVSDLGFARVVVGEVHPLLDFTCHSSPSAVSRHFHCIYDIYLSFL